MVKVKIYRMDKKKIGLPKFNKVGEPAMDIQAVFPEEIRLHPTQTMVIPTGLYVNIPEGYHMEIKAKYGLALKGLHVVDGIISSNHKDEISVVAFNASANDIVIKPQQLIAQILLKKTEEFEWEEQDTVLGIGF